MRIKLKGSLVTYGVVMLLSLGVAGWVYLNAFQPSSPATTAPTATPSGGGVTTAKKPAATPTPTIKPAQPTPASPAVTYRITEAQLTAEVAAAVKDAGLSSSVSNLQVRLQDGLIEASADASMSGFDVPVKVQASAKAVNGQPEVTIESIDLGGFGAPSVVRDQIRRAIEDGLQQAIPRNGPVVVDQITISDGVMTVKAH